MNEASGACREVDEVRGRGEVMLALEAGLWEEARFT